MRPAVVITLSPIERRAVVAVSADSFELERLCLFALGFWRGDVDALIAALLDELVDDDQVDAA